MENFELHVFKGKTIDKKIAIFFSIATLLATSLQLGTALFFFLSLEMVLQLVFSIVSYLMFSVVYIFLRDRKTHQAVIFFILLFWGMITIAASGKMFNYDDGIFPSTILVVSTIFIYIILIMQKYFERHSIDIFKRVTLNTIFGLLITVVTFYLSPYFISFIEKNIRIYIGDCGYTSHPCLK